jgi:type IV pilus assembly protein PilN
MIQINLLPVREARRKADIRQQAMQLLLVLLLTGGVILYVEGRMGDQVKNAESRVQQMETDIKQFKPQLDQVAVFRKKKAKLEKKIDVIEGLDRARSGPVRMLDELATHSPERLWLTVVKTQGNQVVLQGASLDNELVASFLRALGESPFFDQVDLDSTQLGESGGLRVVNFKIQAVFVTPKPQAKG